MLLCFDSEKNNNKIFWSFCSASWIKHMTSGTAISDAISIGRYSPSDCEQKYSGCKLKFESFEYIFETVLNTIS